MALELVARSKNEKPRGTNKPKITYPYGYNTNISVMIPSKERDAYWLTERPFTLRCVQRLIS